MTSPSPDNIIDVAIIGGGVSGAYTAYRLMNTDPSESPALQDILKQSGKDKLNVRLIEMSDRIGGRLWSIHLKDLPNVPADMGGMYFSNLQRNVYGLCTQELGLKTYESNVFTQSNLQYFRHKRFWEEDYMPPNPSDLPDDYYPNVIPFFVNEDEKFKHPFTLLDSILDLVPGLRDKVSAIRTALASEEIEQAVSELNDVIALLREATLTHPDLKTNEPLYKYGLWNVLLNKFSNEAYTMIKQSSPIHSIYGNWNLYNALLGFVRDFFVGPSFHGLPKGYDMLPKTLVQEFEELGGVLNMETELLGLQQVEMNGKPLIKLTVGSQKSKSEDLYARYVVLALPQRALKLLDRESIIFADDEFKNDLIDMVDSYPAFKLFLVYDEPWWEQICHSGEPITIGYSLTDLPLLVCYYMGKESTGKSLLLASFANSISQGFWSGIDFMPKAKILHTHKEDNLIEKLIGEAQRQLEEMHDIQIPEPVDSLFCHWEGDPFGGGWHLWNFGIPSWQVAARIRQPNPDVNIFLCGEAYSDQQGWVEGALNSAEMILKTHFDLPRPDWVPDNYDFGP